LPPDVPRPRGTVPSLLSAGRARRPLRAAVAALGGEEAVEAGSDFVEAADEAFGGLAGGAQRLGRQAAARLGVFEAHSRPELAGLVFQDVFAQGHAVAGEDRRQGVVAGDGAHLGAGLAIGVTFGVGIVAAIGWMSTAPSPLPAVLGRGINEVLFPIGCSLALYAANVLGKRAAG
jgi:hypothetical protein